MSSIDPLGEGIDKIFVKSNHRDDFVALYHHINIYLPPEKAAQILEDTGNAYCPNKHFHTCLLSVEGTRRLFGDVSVYVGLFMSSLRTN